MLRISWVAAQWAASQEGLISMSDEWVSVRSCIKIMYTDAGYFKFYFSIDYYNNIQLGQLGRCNDWLCRLEDRRIGIRILTGVEIFSFHYSLTNGFGGHPVSYSVSTGTPFPEVNRPRRECDPCGALHLHYPIHLTAWCLSKDRYKLCVLIFSY
jgi:hypothetical protein